MPQPVRILTADIGGTNSRFASFALEEGTLTLCRAHRVPTASLRDTDDALAQAAVLAQTAAREAVSRGATIAPASSSPGSSATASVMSLGALAATSPCAVPPSFRHPPHALPETASPSMPWDIQVWCVAGPVLEPLRARLTNAPLELDLRAQAARGARVVLLNDFAAQAWASLALPPSEMLSVLPGTAQGNGLRGVIGAGTGLGTAFLLRNVGGSWEAQCSEAGHTAFPFRDGAEAECAAFFRAQLGVPYVTAEQVLSGHGLELLHRFLGGEDASARYISEVYLRGDAAAASPLARWFGRFYGRMCRHWALSTLCAGGLYVAGGVAARNPILLQVADFAAEFYDAPAGYAQLLRRLPVWLMLSGDAGVWGAARAGQEFLNPTSRCCENP